MEFSSNILYRGSLPSSVFSSPLQSQVDGLVGGFAAQATDWKSLAAMVAGGMAYRAGRIGIMGLGNSSALRVASVGLGLTAEVSTFELIHRSLSSPSQNPNLWRWDGSGGIRQGLLQSFVTFGALKGAGRLAQGENLIAQHLFQDSAMVLGHQLTGALGIAPRPTGSLAEQFLHAEATNLQIGAGMALAGRLTPGMRALERGLDLSLSSNSARAESSDRGFGTEILAPAQAQVGRGDRSSSAEEALGPLTLAMSSTKNNGKGGETREKRISRGEPTLPMLTVWDPYHIDGMPKDAVRLRLEGPPENLAERLKAEIARELDRNPQSSLLVGLEVEKARELDEGALGRELQDFFHRRQADSPLAEGVKVAVVLPAKNTAFILEATGGELRLFRTLFSGGGSVNVDDTFDAGAEASAAKSRDSLPDGVGLASTIFQIFERLKDAMDRGDKEILVQYEGSLWSDSSTENFVKWFKTGRNQLSEDQTAIILLPRQGQRALFFRRGREVEARLVPISGSSSSEGPPTPPPASSPVSEVPRRPTPPAPASRGARRTPKGRSSEPPQFGGVASDLIALQSRLQALRLETPVAQGEIFYAGEEKPGPQDLTSLTLKERQSLRIYLGSSDGVLDVRQGGEGLVATEQSLSTEGPFSAVSAQSWGELFQRAARLLSGGPGETRNPQIFYRGKDWSPERTLEDLNHLLSRYPLREGQSLKIKAGRGDGEISAERKDDWIQIRVQQEGSVLRSETWIPDLKGIGLRVLEGPLGRAFLYQDLKAYHEEALRLVTVGLGNREISEIVSRRVNTQLPVQTLIQSPALRGRLLAAIAEGSIKNRELPRYLEQWIQVHRFLENAYAHLDLETVHNFARNLHSFENYEAGLNAYNAGVAPGERLIPLTEMATDLPGSAFLPKDIGLRDAFARQVIGGSRSVAQNLLFLRDPENMGVSFGGFFNNRVGSTLIAIDFIARQGAREASEVLRDGRNHPEPISEARKDILDFFQELPEILRILGSEKGPLQRAFLRGVLQSASSIKPAYQRLLNFVSQLPPDLQARYYLNQVPTLEELEAQVSPTP